MNWADWVIVGIVGVSSLISIKRGFVKEALSLAIWVAAFVVAMLFSERLALLLADTIETPSVREVVAFIALFAATLVVGALVNHLIGELVRVTGLSGTDRLFGMVFGMARGLVVIMALVIFLPMLVPVREDPWWLESALIPHFLSFEGWARETAAAIAEYFMALFD